MCCYAIVLCCAQLCCCNIFCYVGPCCDQYDTLSVLIFVAGLSIPTLFVGSAQFADRHNLAAATAKLGHSKSTSHVLAKSRHQNFCDVGFWLPAWLLRRAGAVGECDFDATYAELLILTKNFLICHLTDNKDMN
jgi:hypothetical protein